MKRFIASIVFVVIAVGLYMLTAYDHIHSPEYHAKNMIFCAGLGAFFALIITEIESLKRKRGA